MNERGSFLIVAVWLVMFFCVLTAGLTVHAGQEIRLMRRELGSFQDRRNFASGMQEVVERMSRDKPSYGNVKPNIQVEDETSKLNLNHASAAFLDRFFKEFENEEGSLKGQRKDYVKAILKLRYEKRIECLEELILLEDFEAEDLPALRKYVTVYPELPFINPNAASPLVLKALVLSLSGDHAAKEMLAGRLLEARRDEVYFSRDELTPEAFAEKLKLPKTPMMMQVVQEFVTMLTTDSETFHVTVSSKEAKATGVFRCRAGQRPRVLYWHEKI